MLEKERMTSSKYPAESDWSSLCMQVLLNSKTIHTAGDVKRFGYVDYRELAEVKVGFTAHKVNPK